MINLFENESSCQKNVRNLPFVTNNLIDINKQINKVFNYLNLK